MRRNWLEAILLICLITFPNFVWTRGLPQPIDSHTKSHELQRVKRQSNDLLNTLLQLGSKAVPLIMSFFGGSGGSSGGQAAESASASELSKLPTIAGESSKPAASATKVADDKKDKLGLANDAFSLPNLLSMGLKIALALVSNYSAGGLDRNGVEVTPMETVMGIVISALTGSEDPSEVSQMAKQASEVLTLVGTLGEALKTSFSS